MISETGAGAEDIAKEWYIPEIYLRILVQAVVRSMGDCHVKVLVHVGKIL